MSGNGEKKRRWLYAVHRHDPRCRVCQKPTVIRASIRPGGPNLPDTAVLCRWWPRDDPRNEMPPNKQRKKLTCYACAEERHAAFDAARPIEELWMRSGRYGSTYFVTAPSDTTDRP